MHFQAVDHDTKVWVDGHEVAAHRGCYDGASADVTDTLKGTGPQEVVVGVTDETDKTWQTAQCGRPRLGPVPPVPEGRRFTGDDLTGGRSDSLVAWGDSEAINKRIRARHQAGADHVCLHVVARSSMPRAEWRELAHLIP